MAEEHHLTPEEIAQVRSLLKERGLDATVRIEKVGGLPPEKELGTGYLDRLGIVGRCIAWVWKYGGWVFAVLMIPIDCCDLTEFYVPKCRSVVEQVATFVDNFKSTPPDGVKPFPLGHQDRYYAYNPEWRVLSDDELEKNGDDRRPLQPTTIISSINMSDSVISASGVVRGLS